MMVILNLAYGALPWTPIGVTLFMVSAVFEDFFQVCCTFFFLFLFYMEFLKNEGSILAGAFRFVYPPTFENWDKLFQEFCSTD